MKVVETVEETVTLYDIFEDNQQGDETILARMVKELEQPKLPKSAHTDRIKVTVTRLED